MGSHVRETRFVTAYATHRRLRLLCQGLDAASHLLVDGVIVGSSEESDQAFNELRRGALDILRLKDEEGAYAEHFIKMTNDMTCSDITLLWKYLIEYVRKRGRPLSIRPIKEAIAAFLELAEGTPWRPILDKLLPTTELVQEYLDFFYAEVSSKSRSPTSRLDSPRTVQSARSKPPSDDKTEKSAESDAPPKKLSAMNLTTRRHIEDITKRFAEKKAFRQVQSLQRSTEREPKVAETQQSAVCANTRTAAHSGSIPKPVQRPPGARPAPRSELYQRPQVVKQASTDNWWETPPVQHLQPAISGSGVDCWWDGDDDPNDNPFSQSNSSAPAQPLAPPTYTTNSSAIPFDQQHGFRSVPPPSVLLGTRSASSPQLQQLQDTRNLMPPNMQSMPSALSVPSQAFNAFDETTSPFAPTIHMSTSSSLFSMDRGPSGFSDSRPDAFADLNGWVDTPSFSNQADDRTKKKKKKKSRKEDSDGEIPRLPGPKALGKSRLTTASESSDLFKLHEPSPFAMFR